MWLALKPGACPHTMPLAPFLHPARPYSAACAALCLSRVPPTGWRCAPAPTAPAAQLLVRQGGQRWTVRRWTARQWRCGPSGRVRTRCRPARTRRPCLLSRPWWPGTASRFWGTRRWCVLSTALVCPPPLWLRDHRPAALSLPPLPSRRCACCLPVPHMSRRRWRTAGGGWVTPQRWLVQRPQQCPKHGARGQATGGPGGALPPPCTPSLPRRGSAARRQGRRQGAPRRRQPCQWRSRPVTTQLRKQCSRRLRRHLHRRLPSCSGRHLGRRRRACRSCWTISTRCCCPPGS